MEFPQQVFTQLAGKRLFWIIYEDLDPRDVETIRLELARALRCAISPSPCDLFYHHPISSLTTNDASISTKAWSFKKDANGRIIFSPERTGAGELCEYL